MISAQLRRRGLFVWMYVCACVYFLRRKYYGRGFWRVVCAFQLGFDCIQLKCNLFNVHTHHNIYMDWERSVRFKNTHGSPPCFTILDHTTTIYDVRASFSQTLRAKYCVRQEKTLFCTSTGWKHAAAHIVRSRLKANANTESISSGYTIY